jgi:hypothetical protein
MRRLPRICLALCLVALVTGLSFGAMAQDVAKGQLLGVYPDKHAFIVTEDNNKTWKIFDMDKAGQVFINDRPADLMDLRTGEGIVVHYEMQMDRPVATEVHVTRH